MLANRQLSKYIWFISHKDAAQQTENNNTHTIDNGERQTRANKQLKYITFIHNC